MTMIWTGGVSLMPNSSSFCPPLPCAPSSPCASTAFSSDWGVVYRALSPASVTGCWQRHLKEECKLWEFVSHRCIWNKCFRYYRPQGKVTFSEVSVILFTGGGVEQTLWRPTRLRQNPWRQNPLEADPQETDSPSVK